MPSPGPRVARGLGRVVLWSTIAVAGVAEAARAAGWDSGLLAYVVAATPWWVLVGVVAVAIAWFARDLVAVGAAAAMALLGVAWLAPLATSSGDGATVLTVATVNLHYGDADAGSVVALARDANVDVLALQELTLDALVALQREGLEELFPYGAVYPSSGAGGTALYSRVPVRSQAQLGGFTFGNALAVIDWNGGSLTVVGAHPAPPLVGSTSAWERDMDRLVGVLEQVEGPVLAVGDFNATRDHAAFRRLEAAGFVDAPDSAGAGLVFTFPEGGPTGPLVAIDHVLTRGVDVVATSVSAHSVPGTDHRALVVTYADA